MFDGRPSMAERSTARWGSAESRRPDKKDDLRQRQRAWRAGNVVLVRRSKGTARMNSPSNSASPRLFALPFTCIDAALACRSNATYAGVYIANSFFWVLGRDRIRFYLGNLTGKGVCSVAARIILATREKFRIFDKNYHSSSKLFWQRRSQKFAEPKISLSPGSIVAMLVGS